jgi:hypothetical protein
VRTHSELRTSVWPQSNAIFLMAKAWSARARVISLPRWPNGDGMARWRVVYWLIASVPDCYDALNDQRVSTSLYMNARTRDPFPFADSGRDAAFLSPYRHAVCMALTALVIYV